MDFQDPAAAVEAWITEDRMLYGTYPFDEAGSREIAAQLLRRASNILSPPLNARGWAAWLIPGQSLAIAPPCSRSRPAAGERTRFRSLSPRKNEHVEVQLGDFQRSGRQVILDHLLDDPAALRLPLHQHTSAGSPPISSEQS